MQEKPDSLLHSMEGPSQQSGLILQSQQALYDQGVQLLKRLRKGYFINKDGRNRAFRLYAEMLLVVCATTECATTEASSPVRAGGSQAVHDVMACYNGLTMAIKVFLKDYKSLKKPHDNLTDTERDKIRGRIRLNFTPKKTSSLRQFITADNEKAVIDQVAGYLGIENPIDNLEGFIAQLNQHECPLGGQQAVAGGAAETSLVSIPEADLKALFGRMLEEEFRALRSLASGVKFKGINSPEDSSLRLEPDGTVSEDQEAMDRSEGNVVDSDQAATQIQAVYRGATVRRAQQEETQIQAAMQIQSAYRGVMARRQAQEAMGRSEGNVVEPDSVADSSPRLELGTVSSSQTAVGSPSGSNHSSEVNSTAADTLSGPNADATKVNRHQGRDNTLMWLIALAMTVGGVMIQQALNPSAMMPTVGGVLPHMPIYMALYGGAVMLVALILMNKLHDQFDHGSGLRFLSRVSLVSVMIGASVLNGVVSLPLPEVVMTMIPFVTGGLAALIGIGVVVGSCKVVCQSMGQSSVSNRREDGFAPKDLSVGSHSLSGPEAAANSSQGESFRQGGSSSPALSLTS